jgi:transcriptional regulator with XRE-family HTH domain
MKMLLDKQKLIIERGQRAWSQTQLADVSGLSLRTIQRIEKNGKASLESVKALASVYSLNITDLHIVNSQQLNQTVTTDPVVKVFCFLSQSAKVLTTTVFILATLVVLFMLWTNIPPVWINELRNAVFSDQLSTTTLKIISGCLAIIFTLTIAIFIGLLSDAIKDDGAYHYIKCIFTSGELSLSSAFANTQKLIIRCGNFLAKPLMISGLIILISATGVYLTMEDYQKNNMARFLNKF